MTWDGIEKSFNESLHPRGTNGRFIDKNKLLTKQNRKPITDKDFLKLTKVEQAKFIAKAKEQYTYFEVDGVFIAYGKETDKRKYDKELKACKVLARYGHEVYLLSEFCAMDKNNNLKIHGDTVTDDRTLELKETDKNVKDNYKKAKHQAQDVFICIKGDMTKGEALEQIKRGISDIKQNNKNKVDFVGKVYLYFERQDKLYLFVFNNSGDCTECNPNKNDPPGFTDGQEVEVYCNKGNPTSSNDSIPPAPKKSSANKIKTLEKALRACELQFLDINIAILEQKLKEFCNLY